MRSASIIVILFALMEGAALGADYYVAPSGDDANTGTFASPWLTIQKAADTLVAGDACHIRAGTYREAVTPVNSGASENLITYKAYSNETVIINGCDPVVSVWNVDVGSVYKTTVPLALGHENQVFVNGSNMVWEARWPDVGTSSLTGLLEQASATMDAGTTTDKILDSSIPSYDWTGGQAWVSSHKRWFAWTGLITGFAAGEVSVVNNADSSDNMICKEAGIFYLFGVRDALDSANEWYYDSSGGELYLWAPGGGSPVGVEVKTRLYGFDLSNRQYVRIEGLNFFATSIKTDSSSQSLEFEGLNMKHVYHSNKAETQYGSQGGTGLNLSGTGHVLRNSEIAYSSGTGVHLAGSGHEVINNFIHDHDYIGAYASPLVLRGSNFIVSHNTITRAGRQCVQFGEIYGSLFQYNDVSHAGYLTWDLGLIYGNSIAGGQAEVRYNWLHDNHSPDHGNGLYYDHGCKNILSHHNAVWGISGKALTHNQYANYLLWYNNTGKTSGGTAMGSAWNAGQERDLLGCRYFNNVVNASTDYDGSNYVFQNNFINYSQLVSNRYLTAATAPVDAAVPLSDITESWAGGGPDAGAYEIGGTNWVPGHDFAAPPASVDTNRSLARHRNLLINGSFEAGTLTPWQSMGGTVALENANYKSQWTANGTTLVGAYSVELGTGQGGISQTITNLEPNTKYELMGKFRVDPGETAYIGVRNHGNPEVTGTVITDTITGAVPIRSGATAYEWEQTTLTFRTGTNATSAEVYAWKSSASAGNVYFEDAGVQVVDTIIFDEDFEAGLGDWTVTDTVTASGTSQSFSDDAASDGQGAGFLDDDTTDSRIERSISVGANDPLYVQFDFRYTGPAWNPGFQLKQGGTVGINTHLRSAGGMLQYRDSGGWNTLGPAPTADAWYRVTFSMEAASNALDQFDLRLQRLTPGAWEDTSYTNLSFHNALTAFDTVRFHYNLNLADIGGEYHVDNVLVTTSESDLRYLADTDLDGIEDSWETDWFGDLTTATAISDYEGDGFTDLNEYQNGTDPTAAPPPPTPVNVYFLGGQSNANGNWANAAESRILASDPTAIVVYTNHPGEALRRWHTSYAFNSATGRQVNYLTDLYDTGGALGALEEAFSNAVSSSKAPQLAGMLWFQGEGDRYVAESYTGSGYYDEFLHLVSTIESDFDLQEPLRVCLAVIDITNAPSEQTEIDSIRAQQTALGALSTIWAYDTRGLDRTDGVHLTTAAAQTAGTAMAACFFPALFADNFEAGLSGWAVTDDVTVNGAAQSPFDDSNSDVQGALFQDDAITGSEVTRSFAVADDEVLYVQFDYLYSGSVNNPGFQLLQGTTRGINVHLTSGTGQLAYRDSVTWYDLLGMQADAWYRVTFTVQPAASATDQYDIRLQSLHPGLSIDTNFTGLGFQTELSAFDGVKFHYNTLTANVGGEYRIDNVIVTTSTKELNFLADTDADGMDDSWERTHFGNLTTATTTSNGDADSQTDLHEYLSGTDPTSGGSVLAVSSISYPSSPSLSWPTADGFRYDALWSTNLSDWTSHSIHYGKGSVLTLDIDEAAIDNADGIPDNLDKLFLRVGARPISELP